eukprot:5986370-Amphidinium_carterae.1
MGFDDPVCCCLAGNQTGADIIFVIEMFFLVVFIVELGLRIQADGCAFFSLHNFSGLLMTAPLRQ